MISSKDNTPTLSQPTTGRRSDVLSTHYIGLKYHFFIRKVMQPYVKEIWSDRLNVLLVYLKVQFSKMASSFNSEGSHDYHGNRVNCSLGLISSPQPKHC